MTADPVARARAHIDRASTQLRVHIAAARETDAGRHADLQSIRAKLLDASGKLADWMDDRPKLEAALDKLAATIQILDDIDDQRLSIAHQAAVEKARRNLIGCLDALADPLGLISRTGGDE